MTLSNFQPTGQRILVRRLPQPDEVILLDAHDEKDGGEMVFAEGEILAVGPGYFDEDGDFWPTTVKPGQHIIFNARWNDFCHQELKATGCDGNGPLERPVPQFIWGEKLYLITEGDIAGILG